MSNDKKAQLLLINGVRWLLSSDGSLVLAPQDVNADGVPLADASDLLTQGVADDANPVLNEFSDLLTQSELPLPRAEFSQIPLGLRGHSSIVSDFAGIERTAGATIAESGYQTHVIAPVMSEQQFKFVGLPPDALRPDANIVVEVDDTADQVINRYESPVVDLFGTTDGIPDGTVVYLTIRDINGAEIQLTTVSLAGRYQYADANLTALADGVLQVTAVATDRYGSKVSDTTTAIKDTIAEINVQFDRIGSDKVYNAAEISQGGVSGRVNNVEDGQKVQIVLIDANGTRYPQPDIVIAGERFSTGTLDLRSMPQGLLRVEVATVDRAGNPVRNFSDVSIDTQASIDVDFIRLGNDRVYNAAEIATAGVSGSVTNVEDGQKVKITLIDSQGVSHVMPEAVVLAGKYNSGVLDLSSFPIGAVRVEVNVADLAGNPANANASAAIDTVAIISAQFVDSYIHENTYGGYLNATEIPREVLRGTVTQVEDGALVNITVSDSVGRTITLTATVVGGQWQTAPLDLSAMLPGTLTLRATTIDLAGNPATSPISSIIYDPLARLANDVNTNHGLVINQAEVSSGTSLTGTVALHSIEAGRNVTVLITDVNGVQLTGTATVDANDRWTLAGVDLSPLADGTLTVILSATDKAGNPAQATGLLQKDTKASITAEFIDEVVHEGFAGYYNAAEFPLVNLAGIVMDVEEGQPVLVTVTDGVHTVTVAAVTVQGGSWDAKDVDLSSMNEGTLTLSASVTDLAGNMVSGTQQFKFDKTAVITDIAISDSNGQPNVINGAEASALTISGTVTDIEVGRTLTVEVLDQSGAKLSFTTQVQAGGIWTLGVKNVSSLSDGDLEITATGTDEAGNPASRSEIFSKNTFAKLTARFEDLWLNPDGQAKGYYNLDEGDTSVNGVSQANISGTTSSVATGSTINITITSAGGGTPITLTTTALANGTWRIDNVDLSGLNPGTLTLQANLPNDGAGNSASASASIIYDKFATLSVLASDRGDTINAAEVASVKLSGASAEIEAGRTVRVTVDDGNASTAAKTATATLAADGTWQLSPLDLTDLDDGTITVSAEATDFAGNLALGSKTFIKDTQASLTVEFVDGYIHEGVHTGFLNAAEDNTVTIQGVATQVEDGQQVLLTINDASGNSLTRTATISGGVYSVAGIDLSGFDENTLVVVAKSVDLAGNTATAINGIVHDTLASISNTVLSNRGTVLNAQEIKDKVTFTGTSQNIESGRTLTIVISDADLITPDLTKTVTLAANGSWTLSNTDLSSLKDGAINLAITGTDKAGNQATATASFTKDTKASITVEFTDADLVYNTTEVTAVQVRGTVTDIENGQTVTVVLRDGSGHSISLNTTVNNGLWSIPAQDLSAFDGGPVYADASSVDLAGNPAKASTSAQIDTGVEIDILPHTGPDAQQLNIVDIRSDATTVIKGSVSNAAVGSIVTVTLSDGVTTKNFTATLTLDAVTGLGTWQATVNHAGLSTSAPWSLSAAVLEPSGNKASDATPTLAWSEVLSLAENQIVIFGMSVNVGQLLVENADEVKFASSQADLSNIKSENQAITVSVSGDGQLITLTRTDGQVVLTLALQADQSVIAILLKPVDQAPDMERLISTISVLATQNDSDGTKETVIATLPLVIFDTRPFTQTDLDSVVENTTGTGNVLSNDFAAEQPFTVNTINVGGVFDAATGTFTGGTNYSVSANSPAVVSFAQGILTIKSDGTWTFAALNNLDHDFVQKVEFNYVASDADGSIGASPVTLVITDGAAGVVANTSGTLTEGLIGSVKSQMNTINITAGSDHLDASTIQFDNTGGQLISGVTAEHMSSGGVELVWSLSSNGKVLSATAGVGGAKVIELTLSAVADASGNLQGQVLTQLLRPLDHPSSNTLFGRLPITAIDIDGTKAQVGTFELTIKDGLNPNIASTLGVALDEQNLSATPLTGTGTLAVTVGSDSVVSVKFATSGQPALSSNGVSVTYSFSADGRTLTGKAGGVTVLTVELGGVLAAETNSNQSYKVTLFQPLDQKDSSGNHLNSMDLPFVVTVRDKDGDSKNTPLNINVIDSLAPTLSVGPTVNVAEAPYAPGVTIDQIDTTVLTLGAGKDKVTDLRYGITNGSPVVDSAGRTMTQNGQALKWLDRGDGRLDAVTQNTGEVVFRIAIPSTVNIAPGSSSNVDLKLQLYSKVDHLTSAGVANNLLQLDLPMQVVDSDGSIGTASVTMTILDGLDPEVSSPILLAVDEHGLQTSSSISSNGTITVSAGSDQVTQTFLSLQTTGLTSAGLAVTLAGTADANGWWIAKTSTNQEVFRIQLLTDGKVNFQETRPLDHPTGNGTNTLDLVFDARVSDADLDSSSTTTVTVRVTDDIPQGFLRTGDVVEGQNINGNFFDKAGSTGADGGAITSVTYGVDTYSIIPGGFVVINLTVPDLFGVQTLYGVAKIYSDGRYEVLTVATFTFGANQLIDNKMTFVVTDKDGDKADNAFKITVKDSDGSITISPISGLEDTPVVVTISVDPGDVDQGEKVTLIQFDPVGLKGGVLKLNGVALAVDVNGQPILTEAQLIKIGGVYVPNGTLTFTPALNTSHAINAQIPTITAAATIQTLTGSKMISDAETVIVTSDADAPSWQNNAQFTYTVNEDSARTSLNLGATLFDTDGSEVLTYRITNLPNGVKLYLDFTLVTEGMVLSANQIGSLTAIPDAGRAGVFTFDIAAIATEKDNNDSASITHQVVINVTPVADAPTLNVTNYRGTEDVAINANVLLSGALTDTDGSENLSYQLTMPTGWVVTATAPGSVNSPSAGVYLVSAADVVAGRILIQPAEDISSNDIPGGKFQIGVTAISTESTQGGLVPNPVTATTSKTINVELVGVADAPEIVAGNGWSFDQASQTLSATFDEDSLVRLSFIARPQDNQHTESTNFLIKNLPNGVKIVDSAGNDYFLPVVGTSGGKPIYQVSAIDLPSVYLKGITDYSGIAPSFTIAQVSTEPDGHSRSDDLQVVVTIAPVVDSDTSKAIESIGSEDQLVVLNLMPALKDIDGSETITAMTIESSGAGRLFYNGVFQSVGAGGLDLVAFAASHGTTLQELLTGGHFAWLAPEDSAGIFSLPIHYTVTDQSSGGTATKILSTQLTIDVRAQVDIGGEDFPRLTRLESPSTLTSNGAGEIDLTGKVTFTDDDLDGSEIIESIMIKAPAGTGFFITHPLGAIHDGLGNWLIKVPANLTSSTIAEIAKSILDGAVITADQTGEVSFTVSARVLDGADAEMISTTLKLDFTSAANGEAHLIETLQTSIADGKEAIDKDHLETTDLGAHIKIAPQSFNAGAADNNDVLSYRVLAADLPEGAGLAGNDMRYVYDASGKNIVEYVFSNATLSSLKLIGVQEDFAGVYQFPINKVSTDPSGHTVQLDETIRVEIAPVVDELKDIPPMTIREDTATHLNLNLASLIGDTSLLPSKGVETVTAIHFLANPNGGSLSGPTGLLVSDGAGGYTLTDVSRINEVVYTPPFNKHGDFTIPLDITVTDTTIGLTLTPNSVSSTITTSIGVTVERVTDFAVLHASNILGAEDSDIKLTGLTAELFDRDGSEAMTVSLNGVPAGAVILIDRGGSLVQAANNGSSDGGLTYSWSIAAADVPNLVFRPMLNFSGDIPLSLTAVTNEIGTNDIRNTSVNFILGVTPVADGVQMQNIQTSYTGEEGTPITMALGVQLNEIPDNYNNPTLGSQEKIAVRIHVLATSDATALQGLVGFSHASGKSALFTLQADGSYIAEMGLTQSQLGGTKLDQIVLDTGALAFGHLNVEVSVGSIDVNTVLGSPSVNIVPSQVVPVSIDLTPVPDAPLLTPTYEHFAIGRDLSELPLALQIDPQNPAPGAVQEVLLTGLPADFTLNHGVKNGSTWVVGIADVPSLAISAPYGANSSFDINLQARNQLNGMTDLGPSQSLHIELSPIGNGPIQNAAGDGWLAGGSGADQFVFQAADMGSNITPAKDVIKDFTRGAVGVGDQLDLSNVVASKPHDTGTQLDSIIDVSQTGSDTTFRIKLDGSHITQEITLSGVSMDVLYGGSTAGVSESVFLQKLIDEQVLIK